MKLVYVPLAFLLLTSLAPLGSATLPTSITWTQGLAITATGTTNVFPVAVDSDGTKAGFIYQSAVTANYGCRFVYGDVDGWTTTVINSTANSCSAIRFITGSTWVSLFSMSNGSTYMATSTNGGATWNTTGFVALSSQIPTGAASQHRFFAHSLSTFTVLPALGLSSVLFLSNDGGVTWSNVAGGSCPMSNGGSASLDIEYPIGYSSGSLTYVTTNVTRKSLVLNTATSTCSGEVAYPGVVPDSDTGSSGQAGIIPQGWLRFKSTGSTCSGSSIPAGSYVLSNCGVIYSDSTITPQAMSVRGQLMVVYFAKSPGSQLFVGLFGSGESGTYNVTSLVGGQTCQMIMYSSNIFCFYRGTTTTEIRFLTTQVSVGSPDVPPDFGTGLAAFMAGIGFITPESQFLFAIILIGLTTVILAILLKFMGSGRTKMVTVATTAMLVGVFCVVLSLFDLWMYTLGLVLGVFIIRGSKDLRNTVLEIQKFIKDRVGKSSGEGEGEEVEKYVQESSNSLVRVTEEEVDDVEELGETGSPESSSEPEE